MSNPIALGFSKQKEKYNALSSEELICVATNQAAVRVRLKRIKTNKIIYDMGRGVRNQKGQSVPLSGGPSLKLNKLAYAFNGSVYISVALHMYHWDNNDDTDAVSHTRNMKSYFSDETPFALFTSVNLPVASSKKRISTSSSPGTPSPNKKSKTNMSWSDDSKVQAIEAWLNKLSKVKVSPSNKSASRYFTPTVLLLQQNHASTFRNLKSSHLVYWSKRYLLNNCNIESLRADRRPTKSTGHHRIVPLALQNQIDDFVLTLIASKCEFNAVILRPFIIKFLKSFDDGYYSSLLDDEVFTCSLQWIRNMLYRLKQSYRTITNDAGKLPPTWEEDRANMLVRVGYIIFSHNIQKDLFVNMDETPLMIVPSSGKTWAKKGSSNVFAFGAGDKRQITGTPWINFNGDIVLFHATMKGKTSRSLPNVNFRNQQKFKQPVKFMFSVSKNHWVSKETMREQIVELERYRTEVCIRKNLPLSSKLLILWDVYVRHRDPEFMSWIKTTYVHIIVLFIPANLTELVQPLDRWFNAIMKTLQYKLRNEQNADKVYAALQSASGYKPPSKLSELREPFFCNLATVLEKLQTPELKAKISDNCWQKGLFEKCFDLDFQRECSLLVNSDTEGKYFSPGTVDPALTKDRRQVYRVADDFLECFNELGEQEPFTLAQARGLKKNELVGKRVIPLNGEYPGYVASYNKTKEEFSLRYYRQGEEKKRAKKLSTLKYEPLLQQLVYSNSNAPAAGANDDDVEYLIVDETAENNSSETEDDEEEEDEN